MNRVYGLLGLCMKAGRLTSGEAMVEQAIKNGSAVLVIIAVDASDNTKKKFGDMCNYRNIELIELGDKESLGKALGKAVRATLCITDKGFAESLKSKIDKTK